MTQAKLPISDAEREMAAGYILGDLNRTERMQFEAQLRENSALQAEVQTLRVSLRLLPQGLTPVAPPAHLRDRVLTAQTLSPSPSRHRIAWPLIIAGIAVLAMLLTSFDNWRLRRDLKMAQATTPQPVRPQPIPPDQTVPPDHPVRPDLKIAQTAKPQAVATILQQPKSRLVTLRSTSPNRPVGTLLFTPGRWQEIVVALGHLPPLPPDRMYHMWLTLNNGQILLCGQFNPNPEGRVFVTLNPPQTPPKGVKATGVFVTRDASATPVRPQGDKILLGEI
jgi:Anti-sigma-K factor rskA